MVCRLVLFYKQIFQQIGRAVEVDRNLWKRVKKFGYILTFII